MFEKIFKFIYYNSIIFLLLQISTKNLKYEYFDNIQ